MSKCNYPPILNMNGASYEDLYDQYRVLFAALKQTESFACQAFPHGRDFQTSRDPDAATKARAEYRTEVYDKIAQAKEYVHDLLFDVIRQNDEREARKRPRLVTPAEAHVTEAHNAGAFDYSLATSPLDGAPIEEVPPLPPEVQAEIDAGDAKVRGAFKAARDRLAALKDAHGIESREFKDDIELEDVPPEIRKSILKSMAE